MNAVADSRKKVLERIRAAMAGSGTPKKGAADEHGEHGSSASSREYIRRGAMTAEARLERMAERLREYDAEVVECRPEELGAAIAAQLAASDRRAFVAPPGLPKEWLAPGFDWMIDSDLAVDKIEHAEGVVTACSCGVADSGTIVLHHGPMEGRRVITLLPDWHLCILRASQVVETLPEYFDKCRERGNKGTREQEIREQGSEGAREQGSDNLPRLVTWISGPSATADIEMTRIKGVHGPRFLHVILVRD